MRFPLEASSSGESDRGAFIAQDDETVRAAIRRSSQAQAKPCRSIGEYEMVLNAAALVGKRLKAWRQRDRSDVGGLDHHDVGRGPGRP